MLPFRPHDHDPPGGSGGRRACPRSVCRLSAPEPARSDTQRIIAADTEPGSWLTHGRTYGEQRFSPLTKISTDTVGRLGLAWTYEMRTNRGASATPLVVDGVMYVTSAWSLVYALDAATGQERWVYDPKVDRAVGAKACCDVVNRGVAILRRQGVCRRHRRPAGGARRQERIGRLGDGHGRSVAALHHHRRAARRQRPGLHRQRRRGIRRPRLRLRLRRQAPASCGGASTPFLAIPRRDRTTPPPTRSWPKPPRRGTASGGRLGGGGTVWDAIVYDHGLQPADRRRRQRLAVEPAASARQAAATTCSSRRSSRSMRPPAPTSGTTRRRPARRGTTPPRSRSSSPSSPSTAKPRKVAMQAPKNGFFYVVDRENGRLISAQPFLPMSPTKSTPAGLPISWAYAVDPDDGPPGRKPGGAIPWRRRPGPPRSGRRAQLAPDGVQPADGPRLSPGAGHALRLRARRESGHARGVQQPRGRSSTRSPTTPPCGQRSRAPRRAC